uniref:Uncharacterized protein n=1 Tax=Arundo donax TaxID=35708 RepID=A0A0A9EGB1_ARUDO
MEILGIAHRASPHLSSAAFSAFSPAAALWSIRTSSS